jgi:phospholipase C
MRNALKNINHIVVLMLENRSFDHMLGYLSLEENRDDIDGLNGNQSNFYNGNRFIPKLHSRTVFDPDPHHEWENVKKQLEDNNGGFINDFASEDSNHPERIMNYYNASHLPTFDHLAKEFCVCDRWFSSVPGATQPNRIYSLAGHSNGKKNNLPLNQLLLGWNVRPIFKLLPANVSWRYYSHDIASLRYVRGYQGLVKEIDKISSFYDSAKKGILPNVCWIDPDFGTGIYPGPPNDDHPPHDIQHGQNLVKRIYNALLKGPKEQWEKTLLIVVYDEHGGFYDHVSPSQWKPADDIEEFRQYGVRVPALIISPWVGRQVAFGSRENIVFDHTSILKTILMRFCTLSDGMLPRMSARVDGANDLGMLLTETTPRTDYTPAPDLPFKITFDDRFLTVEAVKGTMREKQIKLREPSELEQSMKILANKAIAEGVPPEKL